MERPKILPTQATDEMFANVRYHLDGELVPMLTVEMPPGGAVYFEHHVLLWKYPTMQIGLHPLGKGLKRRVRAEFGGNIRPGFFRQIRDGLTATAGARLTERNVMLRYQANRDG